MFPLKLLFFAALLTPKYGTVSVAELRGKHVKRLKHKSVYVTPDNRFYLQKQLFISTKRGEFVQ